VRSAAVGWQRGKDNPGFGSKNNLVVESREGQPGGSRQRGWPSGPARHAPERTARQQSLAVYRKAGLSGRAELSALFLEDLLSPPT